MKFKLIVSVLILTINYNGLSQNKSSTKINNRSSETSKIGQIKVSIMYPFSEDTTFDMKYYETKHMPMVAEYLGSNLVNYTIEKGLASGAPNTPMAFIAIGTFYVKNLSDYQASIGSNIDTIRSDFANYTDIRPVILISEIIK
ncbi:EthD family reductase [Pseudozobellia sp. WGM2]|uniref:EthD family reductase n=1 Tax=Pseudozobellia sp. WGM2 TaxID=2787625 RepID=UPI001ADF5043|nr:EthD family reductase [Pseudozobellia sp. WGM2]